MIDGVCRGCEVSSRLLSQSGAPPRRSKALRVWLIVGAAYLAGSLALAMYVGHLVMQKVKDRQAWNAAHPTNSRPVEQVVSARHQGPVARMDELKGSGRIYLVQMGDHKAPYSLDDFAEWLRSKYALDVQVLPAMTLNPSAWDSERKQVAAEQFYLEMKREHPDLAADPSAFLFGVTDLNMYSVSNSWGHSFTQRYESRYAVISAYDAMKWYSRSRNQGSADTAKMMFEARVRRILLRDIALLYWRLPRNNDSTSLLQDYLDPSIPADDLYESDLDPARTSAGEYVDGPGVVLTYSGKSGIQPLAGASIQECCDMNVNLPENDESQEIFEVYLASGLLVDRHTDFNIPNTLPIQFERVTRDGLEYPRAFGMSGSHNYNEYLWGKDDSRISVIHADGARDEMVRVPLWMPIQSLAKYVDTGYSGKYYEMHWYNSPFGHFEVKRFDGETRTYLPSEPNFAACLIGVRNAQGQEVKFARDSSRRLTQLTSPNGSWLRFNYGPSDHIAEIDDSRGRTVRYGYNDRNQLTTVTYPSGGVYHYEYDNTQHLLTFSVAPDGKSEPEVLLRNEYENGKIVKQTLADGRVYTYKYTVASSGSVTGVVVRTPEGRVFNIDICEGYSTSTVREVNPQP